MITRATDVLTKDEIAQLTARSDLRGAWAVLSTWLVIAAAFAFLARFPNALGWTVAIAVLGSRQLALAVLMHEAAHRTLFRTRWLNDHIGEFLCGHPALGDLKRYRLHHVLHHARTGRDDDPDVSLVTPFPTTRASLARRFARDLLGVTGIKFLVARVLMDAEILKFTVAHDIQRLPRLAWHEHLRLLIVNLTPPLIANLLLAGALAVTGHAWLYGAWAIAYLTVFTLLLRVRSMAEHACTARSPDMLLNTRTTRAGWLARMTVAPAHVNYHLEHHLLIAVPWFRLPKMHALLRERGLAAAPIGYLDVLGLVSSRRAPA